MRTGRIIPVAAVAAFAAIGLAAPAHAASAPPRFDHVVVLIEENHAYQQIIGPAPYLTSLANGGANFTQSFAVTHPSEPNDLALFSGSTPCRPRTI